MGLLKQAALVLAAGLALAGCTHTIAPAPQITAEFAKAEALADAGCYSCLQEALPIYQRFAGLASPPPGAAERLFNTAVLIAVREKELGIPADASVARARQLVVPSRQAVLDAAMLVIGDTSGLDPEQRAQLTGRVRPSLEPDNPVRRALDAYSPSDVTATYVGLTIDCEQPRLLDSVDMVRLKAAYADSPLLQFRLATCARPSAPSVSDIRAADPRWTDTLYWEGRRELVASMGRAIDFGKALGFFAQGREAFPASLMLSMAWANTNLAGEEFEGALSGFNDVLARYPTHRDALSGRMQALSYLMRHDEAIATATTILDLGTWNISDANYWRAWNRYQIKQFDAAWVNVENATKGLSNARVYMLAGLIAYARKDLPVAVDRFDRAFQVDSSACDAVWMSGLVSIDENALAIAAPKFTRGMTCFISAASALRAELARYEDTVAKRGTPPTSRDERQMQRLKHDADTAEEKSAQSAFNGAQCYARTGNKAVALNHVDAAIAHPSMREKALALKAAIEKLPNRD